MTDETLPPFPVDDLALAAIDHALGGALTLDRPDGAPDDGGPWLIGADYFLRTLLDFYAGTMGDDPAAVALDPGSDVTADAPLWERLRGARVVRDTRVHYSEHDVIRALIAEVRRLRAGQEGRP